MCYATVVWMKYQTSTIIETPPTAYAIMFGITLLGTMSFMGYLLWMLITMQFYAHSWVTFFHSSANRIIILASFSRPLSESTVITRPSRAYVLQLVRGSIDSRQ